MALVNFSLNEIGEVAKDIQAANKPRRKDNRTGYIGINKDGKLFRVRVTYKGVTMLDKRFKKLTEAVESRNEFIEKNNLPHRLNKEVA